MKKSPTTSLLEADVLTTVTVRCIAALRTTISVGTGDISVDETEGVIRGASLMTIGATKGHPFHIDQHSLDQLLAILLAKAGNGVPSRFKHPTMREEGGQNYLDDALGTLVGTIRNPRIVGDTLRGDVYLGDYASHLPGLGDVRSYLLKVAKSNPSALGLSAVIEWEPEITYDISGNPTLPAARIYGCNAVDFVETPAANPNGLLSAVTPNPTPKIIGVLPVVVPLSSLKGVSKMDDFLKSLLVAAGCDPNADEDGMQMFQDGLAADVKAEITSKHAAMKAGDASMAAKLMPAACASVAVMAAKSAVSRTTNATATAATLAAVVATTARFTAADDGDTILAFEQKRVTQISQMGALLKVHSSVVNKCIGENMKVEDARVEMLRRVSADAKPEDTVRVGEDKNIASLRAAIPQAICLRAGMSMESLEKIEKRNAADRPHANHTGKVHERAMQLSGLSVLGQFRSFLSSLGCPGVNEMSVPRLAGLLGPRALRAEFPRIAMLAESASDFASITLDAINKTLRFNYLDAQKTWPIWAARATNPDFKSINRVVLSESPSMIARNEGGELKYTALTDSKEVYVLAEYVNGIKLTRRAIINDDLEAFGAIPRALSNAAARLEDDQAYNVLTLNAAMADTGLLFNANAVATAGGHANLIGSGTAISLASMQLLRQKIKKQKGLGAAARLELSPKFLLVPTSIEGTAENFLNSEKFVATSGAPTAGGEGNPFYKKMTLVPSTRLDDNSATAWYMMADYRDGQINTFEVCFLTDEPEPVLKQETDFDTDDVKYAVRHTVAAKGIDWRGVAKNVGA